MTASHSPGGLIGIVGGVGPYASAMLYTQIVNQTRARCDHDHLPILICSYPQRIPDRVSYLLGTPGESPAGAVLQILSFLADSGATVIGIGCNGLHAPVFFDEFADAMRARGVKLISMVEETIEQICIRHPQARRTGVLCTTGAARAGIYQAALERNGIAPVLPAADAQENLQRAISDPEIGLKTRSDPPTSAAVHFVQRAIDDLEHQHIDIVILACTELFAIRKQVRFATPVIDPLIVLARALIREVDPLRLAAE